MTNNNGSKPGPLVPALSPDEDRSIFGPRSRHQLGIFLAGSSFVFISALLTRRSIYNRYKVTKPPFFHGNMTPLIEISGALEAADALGIATINVFSWGILVGGGLFWAFDISNLTELKQRVKMKGADELARKLAEETGPNSTMEDPANDVGTWPAAALALHEEKQGKSIADNVGRETLEDYQSQLKASHTQKSKILQEVRQQASSRREG